MNFGLPSSSRLKSRSDIVELFATHRTVNNAPLRCIYTVLADGDEGQLMVSVPKRIFRRAVKRNRMKRYLREAYRLQRDTLGGLRVRMAFIYTNPREFSSEEIYSSVGVILSKIRAREIK